MSFIVFYPNSVYSSAVPGPEEWLQFFDQAHHNSCNLAQNGNALDLWNYNRHY